MSKIITMVMPMAGLGSRFIKNKQSLPKPLIEIDGKPFFYWSTLGVVQAIPNIRLLFVVLAEHVRDFQIDSKIKEYFPQALVVSIPKVTAGAVDTVLMVQSLIPEGAVIVNDCDHAFYYPQLPLAIEELQRGVDGFLSNFKSSNPSFSFAHYDDLGRLINTAEKIVISNHAIAGIYGFRDMNLFIESAKKYSKNCQYLEFFISGIYNEIVLGGGCVIGFDIDSHITFGTPEEYQIALTRIVEFNELERRSQ
jgi:dTDP-glucose pyrophosphorylase